MESAPLGQELPFPTGLQRSAYVDRKEWMASARFSTDLMARVAGRPELAGVEILDVGCGTKITKALIDDGWPVARYVGIDVASEVIGWLRANVHDDRFTFQHLAAQNDLYNPGGLPLPEVRALPAGDRPFDLICLFSVFTHLAPADFVAMLRLLRPHIKDGGRLVFSLFLTDPTGAWARVIDRALESDDPALSERALAGIADAMEGRRERFVDEVPEQPLLRARYDRDYAVELLAEAGGWEIDAIAPPERYIQNYMICRPT